MCTVTLVARRHGFLLGMNRDEQRTRVQGLPPAEHGYDGVRVLHPAEPHGGSWIAVNEAQVCFALINWYSVGRRVEGKAASRGQVVVQASRAVALADAEHLLKLLPLARTNPFRLIGVSRLERRVCEWRWDLETLSLREHPWRTQQWISSGHDEPGAQRSRGRVFAAALSQASAGSAAWLRRLHRSHRPGCGPYSTCMHREDAATVSYSEVAVTPTAVLLRHALGTPCNAAQIVTSSL